MNTPLWDIRKSDQKAIDKVFNVLPVVQQVLGRVFENFSLVLAVKIRSGQDHPTYTCTGKRKRN
ncbi:hypothetical protein PM082_023207 [Marasmius tenuissimus]|nr:hypothetical protein PM082_023207 [Marasmius tenuissimus]